MQVMLLSDRVFKGKDGSNFHELMLLNVETLKAIRYIASESQLSEVGFEGAQEAVYELDTEQGDNMRMIITGAKVIGHAKIEVVE